MKYVHKEISLYAKSRESSGKGTTTNFSDTLKLKYDLRCSHVDGLSGAGDESWADGTANQLRKI
jgi:hypothetical protein